MGGDAVTPLADSAISQSAVAVQPAEPQQSPTAEPQQRANRRRPRGKYTLKNGRRPRNDPFPAPTGIESVDVEQQWNWVCRGASKPAHRRCTWKGEQMDVARAYGLLMRERRELGLEQQRLARQNAFMAMPQGIFGMPQHVEGVQGLGLGFQTPIFHSPQATMPAQQFPVGIPQYAGFLQGQGLGYQSPFPQQMQVVEPASQPQFSAGHSAGSPLDPGFGLFTDFLLGLSGDLQYQPSESTGITDQSDVGNLERPDSTGPLSDAGSDSVQDLQPQSSDSSGHTTQVDMRDEDFSALVNWVGA